MTCYLVQPKTRIFVKVYGFLSFVKNMGRKCGINLSSKICQKLLDHAKNASRKSN